MKIVVLGDTHLRAEEPYFSAAKEFFRWFVDQEFNSKENIFIQLGDLYHRKTPTPEETELVVRFNQNLKMDVRYWLLGNHNYDRGTASKDISYSIAPLNNYGETILLPKFVDFFGKAALFLPWLYEENTFKKVQLWYKKFFEENEVETCSYVFYHFPDETQGFDSIDLSFLPDDCLRVGGDIHMQSKNYVGVPFPTRIQEARQKGRIELIDTYTGNVEYVEVPMFLDFYSLKHGDIPQKTHSTFAIWNVYDSPSKEETERKYPDLHIGSIKVKSLFDKRMDNYDPSSKVSDEESISLKEYFEDFATIKNVDQKVQKRMKEVLAL